VPRRIPTLGFQNLLHSGFGTGVKPASPRAFLFKHFRQHKSSIPQMHSVADVILNKKHLHLFFIIVRDIYSWQEKEAKKMAIRKGNGQKSLLWDRKSVFSPSEAYSYSSFRRAARSSPCGQVE
jgi:hypothetical protein